MTDNRNPDDIHYDDSLIRMLGIDREKLPEIVACTAGSDRGTCPRGGQRCDIHAVDLGRTRPRGGPHPARGTL
jgi:hypothetical protein